MPPKASVIILNWNSSDYTVLCLDSLKKQSFKDFEVIIVDNGSRDGSVKVLKDYIKKSKSLKTKLITEPKNTGFAEGNNIGTRASNGKYVALLNSDTVVDRHWLRELVRALDSDNDLVLAGSKVYNKYSEKDYKFEGYGTTTLMGFFAWNKKIPRDTSQLVDMFSVSGGALMFRKSIVGEPFDRDYFAYHEDTYLAWLTRLKGYKVKLVPSSIVYHEGGIVGKKVKGLKPMFVELGERNRMMNLFLFYQFKNLILLLPIFLISLILLNLDFSKIIPRLRAYFWLVMNLGKLFRKRSRIQSQRRVSDKAITKFMSHKLFEEANAGILRPLVTILNKLSFAYCSSTGINTIKNEA